MAMRFAYKGIKAYYEEFGEGEAIVLLHGFLETSTMWHYLVGEFKHTHRVITIDLPGHGKTGCLGYVHSMEEMAQLVMHLLQHLSVSTAKFIGHSMGGYVALAIAHMKPSFVSGLCLMNSTFQEDSEERKELRQRSIEMAKTNYENLVRLSFSNLFAPESRTTFKNQFEDALEVALQTPVQGYIAAQNGMQLRKNHLESFLKVQGPKALIIGSKDTIVDGEFLKSTVQDADVSVCELSGGHMSHIENMYDLTYFLLHFIQ